MIEKRIDKANDSATIVLSPNNSSSWRFNMQLTATLAILLIIISGYFALMGLWVVFLFAGLEIFVLVTCQYIRLHANQSTETINIKGNAVTIIRRCYEKTESWKYPRAWAKLLVRQPYFRGYPKRVLLRSHGKEIELGSFLNKKDKNILIRDLRSIL